MSDSTARDAEGLGRGLDPITGDRLEGEAGGLRELLVERHRRCLPGLARMRTLARSENGVPVAPQVVPELERAMREVLTELGAAERVLVDSLAGTPRGRSVAGFLTARLERLQVVAEEVRTVAVNGDVSALGRRLAQFQALATAMWQVQLSVYEKDRTAGPDEQRQREGVGARR